MRVKTEDLKPCNGAKRSIQAGKMAQFTPDGKIAKMSDKIIYTVLVVVLASSFWLGMVLIYGIVGMMER